jgi:hypothetical protein
VPKRIVSINSNGCDRHLRVPCVFSLTSIAHGATSGDGARKEVGHIRSVAGKEAAVASVPAVVRRLRNATPMTEPRPLKISSAYRSISTALPVVFRG